jgi:hypothetical protein
MTVNTDARTMRACVLHDVRRLEVRDVLVPRPGPRDVLLRVRAVGLCGTDLHIYRGEANYNTDQCGRPVPFSRQPQILGHEIAGEVVSAGAEVKDLRVGDRVAVDQGLNCMSHGREALCEYCATGDSHQCETYAEHGITGLPGGMSEYSCILRRVRGRRARLRGGVLPSRLRQGRRRAGLSRVRADDPLVRSATRYIPEARHGLEGGAGTRRGLPAHPHHGVEGGFCLALAVEQEGVIGAAGDGPCVEP